MASNKEAVEKLIDKVAKGEMSRGAAIVQLDNLNWFEDNEPLTEEEREEIGLQVSQGFSSGHLDSEDKSIYWELKWNKWGDEGE
jgi:hypothetical protein